MDRTKEYYQQKKALLDQYMKLSEELIDSIVDWDNIADILSRKEFVLGQLKSLEDSSSPDTKTILSQDSKQEIDQIIKRSQDLDAKATDLIRREQETILEAIRGNAQSRKLLQYHQPIGQPQGKRLDYKK